MQRTDEGSLGWPLEDCVVIGLLLLFFTHFYIPIVEPVQNALFSAASEDKTAIGQLINAGVWLVAGSLMVRHYRSVLRGSWRIGWTSAFVGCALLSACWSQEPGTTLRKAMFLLLTTAFGIYFAQRYSIGRQLQMICIAASFISLLSISFALLLPRYGLDHDAHEGVWVGVFTQKNVCAREILFLLMCMLPYAPASQAMRWVRRVGILSALVVIAGTQSKTALLMTAMAVGFFLVLHVLRRLSNGLVFILSIAAIALPCIAFAIAASAAPRLMQLLGRDSTMTGRTAIWQAVIQAILKRPALGYGFAAFWLSLRGESANIILALRWAVPAAHNGFLEIWLQLGAVGLLLFGLGFVKACGPALRQFRLRSYEQAAWPLGVLLLTIVYNLDESSLLQANDFLWLLYIATLVNVSALRQPSLLALLPDLSHSPDLGEARFEGHPDQNKSVLAVEWSDEHWMIR